MLKHSNLEQRQKEQTNKQRNKQQCISIRSKHFVLCCVSGILHVPISYTDTILALYTFSFKIIIVVVGSILALYLVSVLVFHKFASNSLLIVSNFKKT
jgi:hypothetical protein